MFVGGSGFFTWMPWIYISRCPASFFIGCRVKENDLKRSMPQQIQSKGYAFDFFLECYSADLLGEIPVLLEGRLNRVVRDIELSALLMSR